jgi:mannose-1-phosphate guanylyltransferase
VTPEALGGAVRRELPQLLRGRLILEPSSRDTAPAIALACATLARREPRATVAVLPTDQVLRGDRAFARAIATARRAAADGRLVCLGVPPDRPATGFGYLRLAEDRTQGRPLRVASFEEKPTLARARRLVRSRRVLWNAGIFVWRVDAFLDEVARRRPAIAAGAAGAAAGRKGAWSRAPKVSVDVAILEKSELVAAVVLGGSWADVGSWDAAARLTRGAGDARRVLRVDSPGSAAFGDARFVALLGVPNVVVVESGGVILVAARAASERLKSLVAAIERRGRADLV